MVVGYFSGGTSVTANEVQLGISRATPRSSRYSFSHDGGGWPDRPRCLSGPQGRDAHGGTLVESAPSSRRSGRVQRDLEDPAQLTKTDLRALARPGSTSLFADGDDDITQVMHRDEIVALDEIAAGASNT
jgi:hypothetical protein